MPGNKKEPMNNNRIKEVRLAQHKTQRDLAQLLNVSEQAIAYYEKALREPPLRSWVKLANYLNVSVSYLQGITDVDVPTEEQKLRKQEAELANLDDGMVPAWILREMKERILRLERTMNVKSDDEAIKKYLALADTILNVVISSPSERKFLLKREKQIHNREEFINIVILVHHIFRMFIYSASNQDDISKKYYQRLNNLLTDYDSEEKDYFDNSWGL